MNALKQKTFAIILASVITVASLFGVTNSVSAIMVCVSETCKAAQAAEAAARAKAAEASSTANSYEAEVARLSAEINAKEAEINLSIAKQEDLKAQIEENERQLEIQQAGLASLLVDMHFNEKTDAISILAGSKSLSELAEKQARNNTIKEQITAANERVIATRNELEEQKTEVERIIAELEGQRQSIAATRAEQAALVEKYQNDAAAYAADANEAHKQMLAAMEENRQWYQTSSSIRGTRTAAGNNTYPNRATCASGRFNVYSSGGYGGYICQCVDYAAWKVYEYTGGRILISSIITTTSSGYTRYGWGNAKDWAQNAQNSADMHGYTGIYVSEAPAANTVAVSTGGTYGHVMWVESVNADGTINISEYNWWDFAFTTARNINPSGLYFIHFDAYKK